MRSFNAAFLSQTETPIQPFLNSFIHENAKQILDLVVYSKKRKKIDFETNQFS